VDGQDQLERPNHSKVDGQDNQIKPTPTRKKGRGDFLRLIVLLYARSKQVNCWRKVKVIERVHLVPRKNQNKLTSVQEQLKCVQ